MDNKIISLWYQGRPRTLIVQQTGASAGHISEVIEREKKLVGEGNVDALRRLASEAGGRNGNIVDAMGSVRFQNVCDSFGLNHEEVIEEMPQAIEMCKTNKIAFGQLRADTERTIARLDELNRKIQNAEKAAEEAVARREESLKRENVTAELLDKFKEVMAKIGKSGPPYDSLERVENFFANAEASNYDLPKILETMAEGDALTQKVRNLANEAKRLENEAEYNRDLLDMQVIAMHKNSAVLDELEKLKRIGFGLAELLALRNTLTSIARNTG